MGWFEEPKVRGWGHRGRTGAAVDLGATLAGSSDCRLSKMRACSVRLLPTLGPGALGKADHRHFPQPFYCLKKSFSFIHSLALLGHSGVVEGVDVGFQVFEGY